MDFLAEFVFELLGEIIMEGGENAASSHRMPRWTRVLILTGLALFYIFVFAMILLVGIGALRELPLISLFLFGLDAVFVFVTVRKARKILRTFSKQ